MKVIKSVIILLLGLNNFTSNAQIAGVYEGSVPFSQKSGNCVWLTNQSADEVKKYYTTLKIKPEKVTPISDKTSDGYRLYYCQPGNKGWLKYWIKITTINTRNSIKFYEDYNPGLLLVPFEGLKTMVGKYDHTQADFKRVYNKYQHLGCRLYKQSKDNQGNLSNDMAVLFERFEGPIHSQDNDLLATKDKMAISNDQKPGEIDSWDHWIKYLDELEKCSYTTIIEYSISPLD